MELRAVRFEDNLSYLQMREFRLLCKKFRNRWFRYYKYSVTTKPAGTTCTVDRRVMFRDALDLDKKLFLYYVDLCQNKPEQRHSL